MYTCECMRVCGVCVSMESACVTVSVYERIFLCVSMLAYVYVCVRVWCVSTGE